MNLKFEKLYLYTFIFVFIGFLVLRGLLIFSKANDIAGNEQNVIYSIQMLIDSGKLYTSPSVAPFSITQYTPIYYYICGFTAKIIAANPDDIQILYTIGRCWNLIFNLITAAFIFKISRSILLLPRGSSWFLFLLSFTFTFLHNFAVRSDSLQDMFGILSIYFFLIYYNKLQAGSYSLTSLITAVFFTAAAVFAKQSGIQFIILLAGFCVFKRDWKTLLKISLSSIIIYGGFLLLFHSLFNSFFENVIGGIANGINLNNFVRFIVLKNISILSIWPLIILSLYFIIKSKLPFRGDTTDRVLATCILGTLIFAAVTALKMGSTVQYFIVFMNLSLLLIFKNLQNYKNDNSNYLHRGLYAYMVLMIFVYGAYNIKYIKAFDYNPQLEKQRTAALEVSRFIKEHQSQHTRKFIFANLTTDYSIPSRQRINNILYRNCLVPQMDILEYSTGPSKVIGYKNLENMLNNGQVEYLIESKPISPFSILNNLEQIKNLKFDLIKEIEGYLIYKYSVKTQL